MRVSEYTDVIIKREQNFHFPKILRRYMRVKIDL